MELKSLGSENPAGANNQACLLCWFVKDGNNFDDKASHYNDRTEGKAQKTKAMLLIVE